MRIACFVCVAIVAPLTAADPKDKKVVWTDPADSTLPLDFKIQGEYAKDGLGIQVIALGNGSFHAVVYPGGLPGAGWDGKNKSLLAGRLFESKTAAVFLEAEGKREYLAKKPEQFSATSKSPPDGHQVYAGSTDGATFKLASPDKTVVELKKIERISPTMGAKPPAGAVVLFDGSNKDEWTGGRVDEKTKVLNTDGGDIKTRKNFNNYTAHLEFMLPYRPDGRGQGRGNSGFYQVLMYEVQVLDSFGLDGKDNECGAIYSKVAPKVNMCLPPLVWQTYDVDFTNAVAEGGKVVKKARLTLKHNGVVVHDNIEIDGKTGGARNDAEGTPGPLLLQGHGNPLQYRNIWVVEKK
jgi:3-keto-disaccharide hydrolase